MLFRQFLMDATAVRRLGLLIAPPLLFAGTVGLPQPAAAQNIYAAVHGTVTDTSEAAIPGARQCEAQLLSWAWL